MYSHENEPDDEAGADSEQFSIAIDDSILSEALASVEKRLGRSQRQAEMDIGPLDLTALAAVEEELAIEIEEEAPSADGVDQAASVEARLRAIEAEQEQRGNL